MSVYLFQEEITFLIIISKIYQSKYYEFKTKRNVLKLFMPFCSCEYIRAAQKLMCIFIPIIFSMKAHFAFFGAWFLDWH